MMKRLSLGLLILLVLLASTAWVYYSYQKNALIRQDAVAAEACQKQGGRWTKGIFATGPLEQKVLGGHWSCEFTYADGGKQCTSDSDCQGNCFLPDTKTDALDPNGYVYGICQSNSSEPSCFRLRSIETPIKQAPQQVFCF